MRKDEENAITLLKSAVKSAIECGVIPAGAAAYYAKGYAQCLRAFYIQDSRTTEEYNEAESDYINSLRAS